MNILVKDLVFCRYTSDHMERVNIDEKAHIEAPANIASDFYKIHSRNCPEVKSNEYMSEFALVQPWQQRCRVHTVPVTDGGELRGRPQQPRQRRSKQPWQQRDDTSTNVSGLVPTGTISHELICEEEQISCPRCKNIIERGIKKLKNIPVDKNNIIGVCDHCRPTRKCHRTRHTSAQMVNKDVSIFGQDGNTEQHVQTSLEKEGEKVQHLLNDNKIKKSIHLDFDIDKFCHFSSKSVREPRVRELVNSRIVNAYIRQADENKEQKRKIYGGSKYFQCDYMSNDILLKNDEGLAETKNIKVSIQPHDRHETYPLRDARPQLSNSFDESYADYYHQKSTECSISSDRRRKKPASKTNNPIYTSRVRKKHSKESLTDTAVPFEGETEKSLLKDFFYIFPRIDSKIPKNLESSSQLIKDTQYLLKIKVGDRIKKYNEKPRVSKQYENIKSSQNTKKPPVQEENVGIVDEKSKLVTDKVKGQEAIEKVELVKSMPEFTEETFENRIKNKHKRYEPATNIKVEKFLNTQEDEERSHKVIDTKVSVLDKSNIEKNNGDTAKREHQERLKKHQEGKDTFKKEKEKQRRLESDLSKNVKQQKRFEKEQEIKSQNEFKAENLKKEIKTLRSSKKSKSKNDLRKEKINSPIVVKPLELKLKEQKKTKSDPTTDQLKMLIGEQQKQKNDHIKTMKTQKVDENRINAESKRKLKKEVGRKAIENEIITNVNKPKLQSSQIVKKVEKRKPEEEGDILTKELSIKKIRAKRHSLDDLILNLIKIKRSAPTPVAEKFEKITPLDIIRHKSHIGMIRSDCIMCGNSELQLDVGDLIGNKDKMSMKLLDIIIGEEIVKHKTLQFNNVGKEKDIPLLFKSTLRAEVVLVEPATKPNIIVPEEIKIQSKSKLLSSTSKISKTNQSGVPSEAPKGIIRYSLSDRSFIEKGWTMLPTEKIVRKMNVYRMRPAHPEFDWFKHNKNKRMMHYDSGERLAEFDDNGRGRWYYRNGRLALDYYNAEEINAQQRFVIYSSGEPDERGRSRPITILATFDYLGNGIVFDHAGKIRLKYNQTEGVVLDRSIGPVSHWKWHTLNDPPVLQQVMIDTQMAHKDPTIVKLGTSGENKPRVDNEDMLAIEFDNFIKEKSKKLTQKFKPFQIKMKALKINENFSLRVLDQATVYLLFRDGSTNIKINIGMVLDHHEIIDTDTAEVGAVSNALEHLPARTDSIAGLQRSVAQAQRFDRVRTKRERQLRPPEPCGSANQLVAAASRPLRQPFRTVASISTIGTNECYCSCRKPVANNIYYNTRPI